MMWKDEFVACFNVFSLYSFGETEENLSLAGHLISIETQDFSDPKIGVLTA
jgi:hypothetical protein